MPSIRYILYMKLKTLLSCADQSTKRACRRMHWRCDDDLLQDVRIDVWLQARSKPISRALISTISSRRVADRMRQSIGRNGNAPRTVHLTPREWLKIAAPDVVLARKAKQELDEIEGGLNDEDMDIFRWVRQGFAIDSIAVMLGVSRNTAWKRRQSMIQKAKAIVRRDA